jgi:Vam6/Vps39-like protein vacuolar protein sorting-associated protein 39
MTWPAPPEEIGGSEFSCSVNVTLTIYTIYIALIKPYIVSILPAGAVQLDENPDQSLSQTPVQSLQIRSSLSQVPPQTLSLPFHNDASPSSVRMLTPSASAKSPVFFVTTPTDRTIAASEGSTVWTMDMRSWSEQIEEFVEQGQYSDALSLLETLDETVLPDKVSMSYVP